MNHKIIIIGNIGSGKSTLARKISSSLPNFHIVMIDGLRTEYGDGSFSKEYLAWSNFLAMCESNQPCILEFSGGGCHRTSIRQALKNSKMNILVIFIDVDKRVCIDRIKDKNLETPYPWDFPPLDILGEIEDQLKSDWNKGFWSIFQTLKVSSTPKLEIVMELLE